MGQPAFWNAWTVRPGVHIINLLVLMTSFLARPVVAQPPAMPAAFKRPAESSIVERYAISEQQLKRHVMVLASDTFEGREAGSRGGHAAAAYIVNQLRSSSIQPIPGREFFQEFGAGYRNVLAMVPGTNPELKNEIVVVGAHYDHVGYGTKQNSNGQVGQIHNGADDNASGVSALIETARHFQRRPAQRPIVFAFWDGEEKGLLGSQYWVRLPTVNRKRIRFVFNTDMIGRLRDDDLEVLGTRTAAGLRRIVCESNTSTDLRFDFNWDIVRDSDHYPFVEQGVPFVMFCTKKHDQYHRPDDDIHTLNFDGMSRVTEVTLRTVRGVADLPGIPVYRPTARFETQATKKVLDRIGKRQPSRLGITYSGDGPIRIRSVTANSPAQQAGLRTGDTILEFGGQQVVAGNFAGLVQVARNPVAVVYGRTGISRYQQAEVKLNGNPARFGMRVRDDEAEPGTMVVSATTPGLPAAVAGLKPRDRIHAIANQTFTSGEDFWKLISAVDGSTSLTIERMGRVREIVISIKQPPRALESSR